MNNIIARTINLEKTYSPGEHNEVKALKGVTTQFSSGEFVAIIGPSGSGKSTFMHLLGALDLPTSGDVEIAGKSLTKLKDNDRADLRAKELGFIFQGYNLLSTLTALENVVLAGDYAGLPAKASLERAKELLKEVGLAERFDHTPAELSGGEQQRVAIARSLMNDGRLILADEPTGELDTKNSEAIVELLRDLVKRKQKTIVMVTHNEALTRFCDRVIKVVDGRLA
ncbi:MAG: ABC transporter ATP-binding protein [Candidatus Kerfeldbacteria bacterium CG08_land_8_20_14_0_20_40_16]|uniref:ABC transporter ATP-binding protein n=1 Tax=Candidatus Kerfeldbacteria bacterium CG08_land_8_20_14_0_20_40_16 TaxID=2014244 RepID=A0A2H0YX40_9BACT|nr:MAG: ABC transporter ATP-binding protein [Candidatus Kerfeldbacteria bacterium CG08_land_8_20_14_0_20_40_16]